MLRYKKVFVFNSAMMPQKGSYIRYDIPKEQFIDILKNAEEVVSYVGYQIIVDLINQMTGLEIKTANREESVLDSSSIVLVMKLPYRIKDTTQKGKIKNFNPDDYEYALVVYSDYKEDDE